MAKKGDLHHAVFKCPLDRWQRIEARHREILAKWIGPRDRILDCGCGYGRLLDLMPTTWEGIYRGVDLSPDFIDLATVTRPGRSFVVGDLHDLYRAHHGLWYGPFFDWAILISVRPMIVRNCPEGYWDRCLSNIKDCAKRLLYLEYDENDNGEIA